MIEDTLVREVAKTCSSNFTAMSFARIRASGTLPIYSSKNSRLSIVLISIQFKSGTVCRGCEIVRLVLLTFLEFPRLGLSKVEF